MRVWPWVLVAGAAWATLAHGNVFSADGSDPRRTADLFGADAAYAPVGRTISDGDVGIWEPDPGRPERMRVYRGQVTGTGFMISPCLMVTNFHTVFGDVDTSPDRRAEHYVRFEVGPGQGRGFRYQARARVVAWGDLAASEDGDWALARVEGCPGRDPAIGWFTAGPMSAAPVGAEISTAGYAPAVAGGRLTVERACRVREAGRREMAHDCAASQGDSGAPVLVGQGARLLAVALTSGADQDSDEPLSDYEPTFANRAVTLDEVLSAPGVRAMVEQDIKGETTLAGGISEETAAAP